MVTGDELSSEIYTLTSENFIQKITSVYDHETDKITNEIAKGLCASCGKILLESNVVKCLYDDLVCNACTIFYNGRSICRRHVEVFLGAKTETMVLISIGLGLDKSFTRKITGLSENTVVAAKNNLLNRKHIKIKSFGLIGNVITITEGGLEVLKTLVNTYRNDSDFKDFLKNVGANRIVEPGSEQK